MPPITQTQVPSAALLKDIATIDLEEVSASYSAAANNNNDGGKMGEMVPVDPSYCEGVSEAGQAKLDKYFDLAMEAVGRDVFNSPSHLVFLTTDLLYFILFLAEVMWRHYKILT